MITWSKLAWCVIVPLCFFAPTRCRNGVYSVHNDNNGHRFQIPDYFANIFDRPFQHATVYDGLLHPRTSIKAISCAELFYLFRPNGVFHTFEYEQFFTDYDHQSQKRTILYFPYNFQTLSFLWFVIKEKWK
jgi:hypothetical protein